MEMMKLALASQGLLVMSEKTTEVVSEGDSGRLGQWKGMGGASNVLCIIPWQHQRLTGAAQACCSSWGKDREPKMEFEVMRTMVGASMASP
ncbi:unnamed protein product [Linum trigynum]|uniref:Uncharacterized protein n=1 Tax=Linum trigynum TaxID=586398 RepID=A0AAV2DZU7_9ROSI